MRFHGFGWSFSDYVQQIGSYRIHKYLHCERSPKDAVLQKLLGESEKVLKVDGLIIQERL